MKQTLLKITDYASKNSTIFENLSKVPQIVRFSFAWKQNEVIARLCSKYSVCRPFSSSQHEHRAEHLPAVPKDSISEQDKLSTVLVQADHKAYILWWSQRQVITCSKDCFTAALTPRPLQLFLSCVPHLQCLPGLGFAVVLDGRSQNRATHLKDCSASGGNKEKTR